MNDEELQNLADAVNRNGHQKYCVWGSPDLDATGQIVAEYEAVLAEATDEKPLQAYLSAHPQLLISEYGFQCRWVIPQASLARMFFPDFLVCRLDSTGLVWVLVELQSPRAELFMATRERPAEQLREGIYQILRWRRWLHNNLDMARRPVGEDGLGLIGITDQTRGLVIIGRENDRTEQNRQQLRQLAWDNHIDIRSYDWLAREARHRIERRSEGWPGKCEECAE
jgi:hypothetical protein